MRRRQAFTIIELLVSLALILFIMVILTEAFSAGMETFRELKAIGDMQERLRTTTALLRRDLAADHFEGRRRLSDTSFWVDGNPAIGFFSFTGGPSTQEGTDPDLRFTPLGSVFVAPVRATNHVVSFSVKLRGNGRDNFFSASLPSQPPLPPTNPPLVPSPLLTVDTGFYNYFQAPDGQFQDVANTYNSQWAEVTYFLVANGTTAGTATPLYSLYRSQLVVVPDNRNLNGSAQPPQPPAVPVPAPPLSATQVLSAYSDMSCFLVPNANPQYLYFTCPGDLTNAANRAFTQRSNANQALLGAQLLMSDVISFDVRSLRSVPDQNGNWVLNPYFDDFPGGSFDTANANPGYLVNALQISIRIWELKTQQTRQVTIIQDM
jgi:type II secretory pathway pseudopilin PulG